MRTTCYCVAVRTAARKTTALYDALLEPAGVTLAQFSLLRKVERAGTVSLTRLGRLAELDRSTIGRNVKALEKLGLVRLGPAEDQREAAVRLTPAGERALQVGAPLWNEAQRRVEAALGATGAAHLQTLAHNFALMFWGPCGSRPAKRSCGMTISEPAVGVLIDSRPQKRPAAFSLSNPLAAAMAERGIYYGWFVAGATFLVMLATAGAMGAPGVIIQPLEKEFGWSTAEISFALAIRLALFGLIAPFAAAFINRFGVRPVVVTAVGMIVAGILASMAMTEVWELVALWGVIVGIGTGMVALVLGATIATRWFVQRRGLVVGMLTASSATGQLIFLPLIAKLTQDHGWRSALAFVVAMLLIAGFVALMVLRDRPADVGLAPFGERTIQPAPKQDLRLSAMMASPLRALYGARASRTFWVLFATFYVCGLSTNGLIQTHWVSLCGDYGIAPVAAAGALAVIGAFDFVGTILSGWLSDRYDNRWLLFVYYGLRGLSLIVLPFTNFTVVGLSAFAVFYGLDWVATVPPTVRLTAERFGSEKANLTFGWIFTAHQLGAATAAFGAGLSRSDFATYLPALYVAGIACLIAATLALTIGRRPRAALATA